MAGDDEQTPDMRTNLLRIRKNNAATRANNAPGNLAPAGGNPLAGALATLETAWVSPSRERRTYAENLEGAGSAITGAFTSQGDACSGEAAAEPYQVDYDDSYEGWKASSSRIDSRVSMSQHYGGY